MFGLDLPLWLTIVLGAWSVWGCGACLVGTWQARRALEGLPSLRELPEPQGPWPRLTLVVTACNEERTLQAAAESLLGQDYPDLEIVLINDRSTDGTAAIVDALAARDERVRPIHVEQLPPGWLGKVHALHLGTQEATGEWVLFCDADVHFAPECLKRAVALAVETGVDHLPVLPNMICKGFWLEATVCAFGIGFLASLQADKLADPDSEAYGGVGAFNLVRAESFRQSQGFSWLRLEVADDVGVGLLLKQAGGRTGMAIGGGMVEVEWYPSLGAMVRGLEKNMFAVFGRYSLLRMGLRLTAFLATAVGPVVALVLPWTFGAWLLTLGVGVAALLTARSFHTRLNQRFWPAVCAPLGVFILSYTMVRSGLLCWARGGVVWKGTFYPLGALAEGQRVKI